ncbi:MAG: bifunctional diaminohydroxyphosphoribosylaminopyrimidine deaminase/5-amino-6-(5-phosphoribosylamino)uracil reductase RibD [Gemmatimonadetes bacterium]|nr:bifunctional diaminohydroxyphosphoribosylaminopyrimidine deaminase/5-amino-6-(5-phosphoribosylamino)uracil reductase RibD [Gemmatimonadota bacterium]
MKTALRLAAKARATASPNPMVGCVIVRGKTVVGRGWHAKAGGPHAEVLALREAGDRARGATLYVTLEPCAHHGRTGPCANAVIEAGVARVVAAVRDPFAAVAGKGFARMRRAGIDVVVGDGADEAARLNEAYLMRVRKDRPWIDLKMAATLDGKIADRAGRSQWITGAESRRRVHTMRRESDAVLVGIGTVLADDPTLSARNGRRTKELRRIVLDRDLRIPLRSRLLDSERAPHVRVVAHSDASARKRAAIEARGATVWTTKLWTGGRVRPSWVAKRAAREEVPVNRLLIEGGGDVAGSFLEAGLVDRAHFFYAPKVLGGGIDLARGLAPRLLAQALPLTLEHVRRFGDDVYLTLVPAGGRG